MKHCFHIHSTHKFGEVGTEIYQCCWCGEIVRLEYKLVATPNHGKFMWNSKKEFDKELPHMEDCPNAPHR